MSDISLTDFLSHYGVKGMRWGVRKKPVRRDTSTVSEARNAVRGKRLNQISDKELQAYINRLNMEQQFSRLNKNKVDRGHDHVKKVLAVGATVNAAAAFAVSPAGRALGRALTTKPKKPRTNMLPFGR